MSVLVASLLSLLSALVVATATHLLSTRRKQRDELIDMRLKAYADFITAASRLMSARRLGQKVDQLDDLAVLNDAKTRICLCAPPDVVHALVHFWGEGGTLEQEGEVLAFTNLVHLIRRSLGGEMLGFTGTDLSSTLFRLEPSTFSFRADNKVSSWEELAAEAQRVENAA